MKLKEKKKNSNGEIVTKKKKIEVWDRFCVCFLIWERERERDFSFCRCERLWELAKGPRDTQIML